MKPIAAHYQKYPDIPVVLSLLVVTAVLFWPATWWIAQQTLAHEQLRQSFFLLGFAAVVMWLDHRRKLTPVIEVSRPALLMLSGAFLLLGTGLLFPYPFLPLLALALALGAFVHVFFGNQGFNLTLPWIVGFGAFLLFVLFFHFLDWPLREMAGIHSAQILVLLGQEVELRTVSHPGGLLLLSVNQRLFEVAAECNGFGLISTSAILALLLVFSRPLPIFWKLAYIGVGIFIGFSFNILRILGIVSLAPLVPNHYDLMHEIVGLGALFGGLVLLWWIVAGRNEEQPPEKVPSSLPSPSA
jgi:exosortase/archaeosortase family protein